jgi:alanyl-tRNA synthetase
VVLIASAEASGGGSSDGSAAVSFVVAVNSAGQSAGLSANEVVRAFAPVVGARGGGKADLAQGAGGDSSKLTEAFVAAREALRGALRG